MAIVAGATKNVICSSVGIAVYPQKNQKGVNVGVHADACTISMADGLDYVIGLFVRNCFKRNVKSLKWRKIWRVGKYGFGVDVPNKRREAG